MLSKKLKGLNSKYNAVFDGRNIVACFFHMRNILLSLLCSARKS